MKEKLTFVTAGCSFTDPIGNYTWPSHTWKYLSSKYRIKLHNEGLGCIGNGLIMRRCMHRIHNLLNEGIQPDKMLVGVMWSGATRVEWFTSKNIKLENIDNWGNQPNPINFVTDADGGWVYGNAGWENEWARDFYRSRYCDLVAMQIKTYEHIITLQSYLQAKGIKYFMTPYTSEVLQPSDKTNHNTSWLLDMIDWEKWLPVAGCLDWCALESGLPLRPNEEFQIDEETGVNVYGGLHPTPEQQRAFARDVVVPFLESHYGM